MTKRTINGHEITFYDSIEDLPIKQFHRYSKYLLVEGGIGDSIQDIDRHITRIINYVYSDAKKAHQELLNLRQNLYLVVTEQDVHNKATLCLVKAVDGKEWTDFSEEGMDALYRITETASIRELNEVALKVRQALDENLILYFPHIFEDASQKNFADLVRKRALLQISAIVKGDANDGEIKKVTESIYAMQTPKGFYGADSEEIKFDKQFEDMCLLIAKEFGGNIKQFTTMEFYSAFERLSKQAEETKKLKNRRNK